MGEVDTVGFGGPRSSTPDERIHRPNVPIAPIRFRRHADRNGRFPAGAVPAVGHPIASRVLLQLPIFAGGGRRPLRVPVG